MDLRAVRLRWASLGAGMGCLLLLVQGGVTTALAAWLAAVFLLHFSRNTRPLRGYLILAAAQATAIHVISKGMIPAPPPEYLVICIVIGLSGALPYLLDRWLVPHLRGLASTLLFPAAVVFVEFVGSLGAPFGTWGSLAYTQAAFGAVAAVISLAGIWGLVFLIAWLAACVHALTAPATDASLRGRRRPLLAWSAAMIVALVAGQWFARSDETVATARVAAVKPAPSQHSIFQECESDDLVCRRSVSSKRHDALFADSAHAAEQGAKLVLWSEAAAEVLEQDEPALIERGQAFARRHQVYLLMGLLTVPDAKSESALQDKLVVVQPSGEIAHEYHKNKPVPGEPLVPGNGELPILVTPFGRIASVICFDADFPALIHQASEQQADLLLVSAADWPRIASIHAQMSSYRGIENGVALLRATGTYPQRLVEKSMGLAPSESSGSDRGGISFAADSGGRIVASDDGSPETLLMSDLPVKGRWTPYRVVGDALAWACLIALVLLGALSLRNRRAAAVSLRASEPLAVGTGPR